MTEEQILDHYDPIPYSGCWIWKGGTTAAGYGRALYGSRLCRVSRLMYRFHYEVDPGSLCVCHICDTPSCINPDHLFLGTNKDNTRDSKLKGRRAKCGKHGMQLRGEDHGGAKLTEADVKDIRKSLAQRIPERKIARDHDVSRWTIRRIKTREAWGWL